MFLACSTMQGDGLVMLIVMRTDPLTAYGSCTDKHDVRSTARVRWYLYCCTRHKHHQQLNLCSLTREAS